MTTISPSRAGRLRAFAEADPANGRLVADAAAACLDEGAFTDAVDLIDRYAEIAPLPDDLRNLRGLAALSAGRYDEAACDFETLLATSPADPVLRFNLAWCRGLQGAWQDVVGLLDASTVQATQKAAALKVQALHHLGQLDEALAWGQDVVGRGGDRALYGALAAVALDSEALDLARSYAAQAGETAEGLSARGMLLLNAGNPDQALELFSRALDVSPQDGRAHLGRGLSLLSQGETREAARELDVAAGVFHSHSGSWVAAGWAYFTLGDLATSRARFDTALALDDTFAEAHGGLAVIDFAEGRFDAARKRAEVARRLDRDGFAGALVSSLLLEQAGDASGAERVRDLALNAPAGPDGQSIAKAMANLGRRRR